MGSDEDLLGVSEALSGAVGPRRELHDELVFLVGARLRFEAAPSL